MSDVKLQFNNHQELVNYVNKSLGRDFIELVVCGYENCNNQFMITHNRSGQYRSANISTAELVCPSCQPIKQRKLKAEQSKRRRQRIKGSMDITSE